MVHSKSFQSVLVAILVALGAMGCGEDAATKVKKDWIKSECENLGDFGGTWQFWVRSAEAKLRIVASLELEGAGYENKRRWIACSQASHFLLGSFQRFHESFSDLDRFFNRYGRSSPLEFDHGRSSSSGEDDVRTVHWKDRTGDDSLNAAGLGYGLEPFQLQGGTESKRLDAMFHWSRDPEGKSFLQRCVEADGAEGLSQVADEVARLWARVNKAAEPNRSLCNKIAYSFLWNKHGPQAEAKHRKEMNEMKAELKLKLKKLKPKAATPK